MSNPIAATMIEYPAAAPEYPPDPASQGPPSRPPLKTGLSSPSSGPPKCPPHLTGGDGLPMPNSVRLEAVKGNEVEAVEHEERECERCHRRVCHPLGKHRYPRQGWELRAVAL